MKRRFRPVFIGGCDRSGTTMLGDILGAAKNAFATPESQFFHELLPLLHLRAFATAEGAAIWLREHFRFATWEVAHDTGAIAALIDLNDPRQTVERILSAYLGQHRPEKLQAGVWIDHTPDNFKHYAILRRYFPEARYIHIVRDGRDVFCSVRDLDWGPNNAYTATRYWNERLQQALGVEISEGENCHRVRYEDILRDPGRWVRMLCHFADLTFGEAMIEGGGVVLPVFTRSQHQLVGRRPDASRIGRWRQQMRPAEVAEFEAWGWSRRLLVTMGYELVTPVPEPPPGLVVLWRYLHEFLMYGIHRARHRKMEENLLLS